MVDHQLHDESENPEQQTALTGLDIQIRRLGAEIANLMEEKKTLEQARSYILSTNNAPTNNRRSNTASSDSISPSTPPSDTIYPSSLHPSKKPPTSLRQQAIIRSALERDQSPSPPTSSGLLPSEEFEAAFENGGDQVRMSVEGREPTSPKASPASSVQSFRTTSPAEGGNGEASKGVSAKRATKRKRQENAAKAREVRMRKLNDVGRRTI